MLAALALDLGSSALAAQEQGTAPAPSETTRLWITALDKAGPVTDLKKEEIDLSIGKQEQTISALAFNPPLPLSVGFLIDVSGSRHMGWPPPEIGLAPAFLGQVLRSGDSAFVVSFNDTAHLNAKPTDDQSTLARALQQMAGMRPGYGTALYDAIGAACRVPTRPNFHHVLVVLTDGQDNSSQHTREEAMDVARGTGTTLYLMGHDAETGRVETAGRGFKVMREMASATGGAYFGALSKSDAESAFDSLAHILRAEYALDFQPSLLPKKDQQIRVRCSRKGVRLIAPDLLAK
ncbi:MAG: VWA domain-containing protein [Terriglobia bacterium]